MAATVKWFKLGRLPNELTQDAAGEYVRLRAFIAHDQDPDDPGVEVVCIRVQRPGFFFYVALMVSPLSVLATASGPNDASARRAIFEELERRTYVLG